MSFEHTPNWSTCHNIKHSMGMYIHSHTPFIARPHIRSIMEQLWNDPQAWNYYFSDLSFMPKKSPNNDQDSEERIEPSHK